MKQKKYETTVTLRWNKQLWEKVKEFCDQNKLEYSDFIREATYEYMQNYLKDQITTNSPSRERPVDNKAGE